MTIVELDILWRLPALLGLVINLWGACHGYKPHWCLFRRPRLYSTQSPTTTAGFEKVMLRHDQKTSKQNLVAG